MRRPGGLRRLRAHSALTVLVGLGSRERPTSAALSEDRPRTEQASFRYGDTAGRWTAGTPFFRRARKPGSCEWFEGKKHRLKPVPPDNLRGCYCSHLSCHLSNSARAIEMYDLGLCVPIGDVYEVVSLRWSFHAPFNPELNSRVDELGEYRGGHKKLTPLGVVSGCRLRRDRFCERLTLLFEF